MKTAQARPGPRYQALLQLLHTAETLWNASRVFFVRWDLSPSQFNLLNLLSAQPQGATQSDLSRSLIMHRSNVTGLVDRLEERGLVRRQADAADRRAWRVQLTSAGRKLLEEILPEYYGVAEDVWGQFPVKRADQLVRDLGDVAAQAERMAAERRGHLP